jgi:hypothetical protein
MLDVICCSNIKLVSFKRFKIISYDLLSSSHFFKNYTVSNIDTLHSATRDIMFLCHDDIKVQYSDLSTNLLILLSTEVAFT